MTGDGNRNTKIIKGPGKVKALEDLVFTSEMDMEEGIDHHVGIGECGNRGFHREIKVVLTQDTRDGPRTASRTKSTPTRIAWAKTTSPSFITAS